MNLPTVNWIVLALSRLACAASCGIAILAALVFKAENAAIAVCLT